MVTILGADDVVAVDASVRACRVGGGDLSRPDVPREPEDALRRSGRRRRRGRHAGRQPRRTDGDRPCAPGGPCSSRSRSPAAPPRHGRLAELADEVGHAADGRSHVPVQPTPRADPLVHRGRHARTDPLRDDVAVRARPVPQRRQRHLGPRPARHLDPLLPARRVPHDRAHVGSQHHPSGLAGRRVHDDAVPVGRRGRDLRLVAGAAQGPQHDHRRRHPDARVRRHGRRRADQAPRQAIRPAGGRQLRGPPADVPHR